jgi:hypothetical protein
MNKIHISNIFIFFTNNFICDYKVNDDPNTMKNRLFVLMIYILANNFFSNWSMKLKILFFLFFEINKINKFNKKKIS